jgi:hypothetical protein
VQLWQPSFDLLAPPPFFPFLAPCLVCVFLQLLRSIFQDHSFPI